MNITSKRKKPGTPESSFPEDNVSSFLLMKHTDVNKTLNSVSPFLIEKTISALAKDPINIKKLKTGSVLIETNSSQQTNSLLKITSLQGQVPVMVVKHPTMNNARGVLRCWVLGELSEEEAQEYFHSQGVINVRRLSKPGSIGIPAYLLIFENKFLPTYVNILSEKFKLEPYYPPPLRCHQCLAYGHGVPCSKPKVCPRCAQKCDHDPSTCTEPILCAACNSSDHDVRSPKCPKYISERQAIRLSYQVQIPIPEARIHVKKTPTGVSPYLSYSACLRAPTPDHQAFPPITHNDSQSTIPCSQLTNFNQTSKSAYFTSPMTPSTHYSSLSNNTLTQNKNSEQAKLNALSDEQISKKQPIIKPNSIALSYGLGEKQLDNSCPTCEKLVLKVEQLTNQVTELTKVVNNLLQTITKSKINIPQNTNNIANTKTNKSNTKNTKANPESTNTKTDYEKPSKSKSDYPPLNKFSIPESQTDDTSEMDISDILTTQQ